MPYHPTIDPAVLSGPIQNTQILTTEDIKEEWVKCSLSVHYFVHTYCYIYDAVLKSWIPFHLWPAQVSVLKDLKDNRLVVILKARQLGQTWLVLSFALWLILFQPSVTILLFSRRDDESKYLMERLRGIYSRLPAWMQVKRVLVSNTQEWRLSNGSVVYAFPTTAGDSYTASMAIVDEADLVPNLPYLMNAVKPTIDNGGRMILLSRSEKDEPQSMFKNIYRGASEGKTSWKAVFLPWFAHPGRTQAWYEIQKQDALVNTGSLDDLWQQYPATDSEALVPRTMSKRLPAPWVEKQYAKTPPLIGTPLHAIHQLLVVHKLPEEHHDYVIGVDPAEGNPSSDPSALTVLDKWTGEEVASLNVRVEPSVFGEMAIQIAHAYNNASFLVERNNHGHVVIKVVRDEGRLELLAGMDGDMGWHTNTKSKATMYSTTANAFKDGTTTVHTAETFYQLCSIEGTTLKAPEGERDDLATSYALALQGIIAVPTSSFAYTYINLATAPMDRRSRAVATASNLSESGVEVHGYN